MKSINKTTILHRLRNAEHFQIHWAMSRFLEEPIADFTELTAAFAQYKQLFEHEDVVFKHKSKMVGTQAVVAADRKRDNEFIMLRMIVKSALRSIDPEIQEAAEILMPIVDNYKHAPHKSYNEATALITNFIQDLKLTGNQPYVVKMGLTSAIELLEEANETFQTLFYRRNRWVEHQKLQGNMRKIRPQVDEAFDAVVNILNAAYTINEVSIQDANKQTKLAAMIDEINQQLASMARAIAYRQPGYTSPDPNPSPGPEPGPGPVVPFRFEVEDQSFGYGGRLLYLGAYDHDYFDAGIDPSVIGAIINFETEVRPNRFTITDIARGGPEELASGLLLTPTDDQDLLGSFSEEKITVEAIKDERVVLIIDEVKIPNMLA